MSGFDDFLSGNGTIDTQPNSFDKFVSGEAAAETIKQSFVAVDNSGLNPDQAAEAKKLAAKTGIPRVAVEATLPEVKKKSQRLDLLEAAKSDPAIAAVLSDPNVAKITMDDVGALQGVSNAFQRGLLRPKQMVQQWAAEQMKQEADDKNRSFMDIVRDEFAKSAASTDWDSPNAAGSLAGMILDVGNAVRRFGLTNLDTLAGVDQSAEANRLQDAAGQTAKDAAAIPRFGSSTRVMEAAQLAAKQPGVGGWIGAAGAYAADPIGTMAAIIETGVEMAPQLAAMIGVTAATRSPKAGAAVMGVSSGVTERYTSPVEFFRDKGIDVTNPEQLNALMANPEMLKAAQDYGFTRGSIIGVFDALSGGVAAKALASSPVKNLFAQFGVQAGLGGGGEAAAQYATKGEVNPADVIMEALGELFTTPIEVATLAYDYNAKRAKADTNMQAASAEAEKAVEAGAGLDAVVEAARATKTLQRDPETFKVFMDEVSKQTGIESVYIPADKAVEYFQSVGLDPFALPGIDPDELSAAVSSGGDIAIPLASYVSDIAPEHHESLSQYVRMSEEAWTPDEAAAFDKSVNDLIASEDESIRAEIENNRAADEPRKQVFEAARAEYVNSGVYTPDVAAQYATVESALPVTFADRAKGALGDAVSLYKRVRPLKVVNAFGGVEKRKVESVDFFIGEAKAYFKKQAAAEKSAAKRQSDKPRDMLGGKKASKGKVTPRPLLNYLIGMGGIDPKGKIAAELKAMDITPKRNPSLFRVGGKGDLDNLPAVEFNDAFDWAEVRAEEDGNGYVDRDWLLEKIREESFGNYFKTLEERGTEQRNAEYEEFRNFLAARDLELDSATNEEIKAAVKEWQDGRELYQITPEVARGLNYETKMPDDPLFAEAVANTAGAEIISDGLLIDLVRFQKPEQEGAQAVRTGVFYLPVGSKNARYYRNGNTTASSNSYGGTEKHQGETLIRRPLFVKGATGGKAPEAAYELIRGKGSLKKLQADVMHHATGLSGLSRDLKIESIQRLLTDYGANKNLAYEIYANSQRGNQMRYAVQENIIAHVVREAGYDSVVGYSKGKTGASISEVFDVRELTYPAEGMDSEVHEQFYQSVIPTETEAFKNWFGDSKVVDADGKPLVVYHGTNAQFDAFEKSKLGSSTGSKSAFGGFFFTDNKKVASGYGELANTQQVDALVKQSEAAERDGDFDRAQDLMEQAETLEAEMDPTQGTVTYATYLSIQKPLTIDADGGGFMDLEDGLTEMLKTARKNGNDGIIISNFRDNAGYGDDTLSTHYIVLEPTQIKSIKNRGTFDANDPRILYQDAENDFTQDPRFYVPNVRGGWTVAKITKYLKSPWGFSTYSKRELRRTLREFSSPEELSKNIFYHGSAVGAQRLRAGAALSAKDRENFGGGYGEIQHSISLSSSRNVASNFTAQSSSGVVYPIILKKGAKLIERPDIQDAMDLEDHLIELWSQGVDAVKIGDHNREFSEQEVVVLNPRAIHRLDGERFQVYQKERFDNLTKQEIEKIYNDGLTTDALEQRDSDTKRGSYSPADNTTRFFQARDLSTALHEAGHRWLEFYGDVVEESVVALERRDLTDEQIDGLNGIIKDYEAILKHLGVASRDDIKRDQHEEFARTVEAYFLTGKAPSVELEGTMQRFAKWLKDIYVSVRALNVRLNPEITAVLDRMLATDEQIADAEKAAKFEYEVNKLTGATPAENLALAKMREAAKGEANQTLLAKVMEPIRRRNEEWYKEESAKVADQVRANLEGSPEWRALQLVRGTEGVDPVKLDLTMLEDQFGSGVRDVLPKGATTKQGGIDPDIMAEQVGLPSARELVEALGSIKDIRMADMVKSETDRIMQAKYGDILTDGSIEAEAQAAIHNEKQAELMALELKILRRIGADKVTRSAGERRVSSEGALDPQTYSSEAAVADTAVEKLAAEQAGKAAKFARSYDRAGRAQMESALKDINPKAIREAARRVVGKLKTGDLGRTAQYSRAELKAAEAGRKAIAKRDYEAAAFYKYRQLLNHYLYIETKAAQVEADKMVQYLNRLASKKTIASVDQEYLEQIHGLLEKYDFKAASQVEVERRRSFAEWAAEQEAAGREVIASDKLRNLSKTEHYSRVPLDDIRGLRDAVKQIEHFGRLKQKLADLKEERDFQEVVTEAVEQVESLGENFKERANITPTKVDRLFAMGRGLDASLLKIEQIVEWLDGGNPNGVFNRIVFRRIADAQTRENDLALKHAIGMEKIMSTLDHKRMSERFVVPGKTTSDGRPLVWDRSNMMAAVLNMGNEENLFRLQARKGNDLSDTQLEFITSKLNKAEAEAVQKIWDLVNGMWPEIEAMEKRLNGVAPPKVEAREFDMIIGVETPGGGVTTVPIRMRGGYYPIVYDAERSEVAARQEERKNSGAMFENNYVRATTQRGHTKERQEGIARAVRLDMNVLPQHISQVSHDIAFREAVMEVDRFMSDKRVKESVKNAFGPEIANQFRPWLQAIANDRNANPLAADKWEQFARGTRTNATIVGLGLRFTTMMAQVAGLSASAEYIGPKWVGIGLREFFGSPTQMRAVLNQVMEESGEMRHRHNTMDRDIRDGLRQLTDKSVVNDVRRFAFIGIAIMDKAVSIPTYLGAKQKALADGMSVPDAIAYGEKAVRMTQGAGGTKDLAAVQRGSEFKKWMTMFYSYFNVLYNRQRDIGKTAKRGDFAEALARSWWLIVVPAIAGELLTGKGPDDDENEAAWAARKIAMYPFASIPIVRDVVNGIGGDFGYKVSPITRVGETAAKLGKSVIRVSQGEDVDPQKIAKDGLNMAGFIFGLPLGQVATTADYIWDVIDGDQKPEGVLEFGRGVTIGPKRD